MNWDYPGENLDLTEAVRLAASGSFIRLSDGFTHYELAGPPGGQAVALVHGFSVPYYIWDPTFPALAQAGLRVLRYDLYGRGYSDRPRAAYGPELFIRQLLELLDGLGLTAPADVVGLSMGGPIAAAFADRHPGRVRRLGLIDPAGMPLRLPLSARLARLPLVGELALRLVPSQRLVDGLADDLFSPGSYPEYRAKYREQMPYRGFRRALLSTSRSPILEGMAQAYRRVGWQDRRVLLIWGEKDSVLPLAYSARLRAVVPQAEYHPILGAGHIPHYERPEVVNPLLVEFFQRP